MKKRRIFIAINLPEHVKKGLYAHKDKWPELPCRWTEKDNLHITLIFLGYLSDEEMLEVCNITKKIAANHNLFSIKLSKIIFGPPKKPPRMIWAVGEKSEEFSRIKNDLERSLFVSALKFMPEIRAFSPHITLARINAWGFKSIEKEERPEINEDIDLSFEVNSIDVMESELKRGGPEYVILESCPLRI